MNVSFSAFQKHHPIRATDWRWQRACALQAKGSRLSRDKDDEFILRSVRYIRALDSTRCPERLPAPFQGEYPDLLAAHQLHDRGGELRWELESRLLAGQSSQEIEAIMPLAPPTVDAFEAIFFNVRDRLGAQDWVCGQVIGIGYLFNPDPQDLPDLWKAVAYSGGPLVLDVVLAATSERHRWHRYSPELIRQAQRLVAALLTPLDQILANLGISGKGSRAREHEEKCQSAAEAFDKIINDIGDLARGKAPTEHEAHSAGNQARHRSPVGEDSRRGARADVA